MARCQVTPASLMRLARVYRASALSYRNAASLVPDRDRDMREALHHRAVRCFQLADAVENRAERIRLSRIPRIFQDAPIVAAAAE